MMIIVGFVGLMFLIAGIFDINPLAFFFRDCTVGLCFGGVKMGMYPSQCQSISVK